jgi:hypothetical protein
MTSFLAGKIIKKVFIFGGFFLAIENKRLLIFNSFSKGWPLKIGLFLMDQN